MKKFFSILFLLDLLSAKSQLTFLTSDSLLNYLKGSWTWQKTCGGLAGTCKYPATEGTEELIFTRINGVNDSILFKVYKNGSLVKSSGAQAIQMAVAWKLRSMDPAFDKIVFANYTDSLQLEEDCADCYGHFYFRNHNPLDLATYENDITDHLVYPVPAETILNWDLQNVESVRIFSTDGKLVQVNKGLSKNVDVSSLQPGIYFILLKDGGKTYRARFIRQNP